ncbi:Homeobox-leucine zipper protein ATHB-15 [Zea mays]|uniref:Homeobox-leucine zipper protein ATHB-15 n=1 Tax=Zea mays TaxID=4577 RepID=A0A1D6HSK9_MAIZE|nr:Homeobox-leucine zipper protein ATHB-15 [Zea mays]
MNKLLMEENDRLQKQVSRLVLDNGYMKNRLHSPSVATTDTTCECVVTSGQHNQQPSSSASSTKGCEQPSRVSLKPGYISNLILAVMLIFLLSSLLAIAEETLAEFMSKATGTAVNWVQMVGMEPGPDSALFRTTAAA